jgi:putative heme-binding domain-containing protein
MTRAFDVLRNDKDAGVREEALRTLASMRFEQIGEAIRQAISDRDKRVRVAGIDLIDKMDISNELKVTLLKGAINTGTTGEKQAALLTLGKLPLQYTSDVFADLLAKMNAGKLSSDILLELGEAIDSSGSTSLISKYKSISAVFSPDTLIAAYSASLFGGDADKGRRVFFRNQSAQCIRCHSYDDVGGNAGPRLNGVGERLSREELLESLINPSSRLSPGFGTVNLELKNGQKVSGVIYGEDNKSLTLRTGGQTNQVISKDQIIKRVNSISAMPTMKNLLTKKEIRDLISFLATLKEAH